MLIYINTSILYADTGKGATESEIPQTQEPRPASLSGPDAELFAEVLAACDVRSQDVREHLRQVYAAQGVYVAARKALAMARNADRFRYAILDSLRRRPKRRVSRATAA
jgi:hypothetical protein